MRAFFQDRIRLVNDLIVGGPEVAYADLVLILTAVLSGCAAHRWPGKNIDQRRFVELLIQHSPAEMHCDYVCLAALLRSKLIGLRDTPWGVPGEFTRIFRDDEIDVPLSKAQTQFPQVSTRDLKRHTYASLIYSWLRCPYAHEYTTKGVTSHMPATASAQRVSYIGRMLDRGITYIATFHLDYILALAAHHASQAPNVAHPLPAAWWLDTP